MSRRARASGRIDQILHERNHHRQAGAMKDRRRELTDQELIEEQAELWGPGCPWGGGLCPDRTGTPMKERCCQRLEETCPVCSGEFLCTCEDITDE